MPSICESCRIWLSDPGKFGRESHNSHRLWSTSTMPSSLWSCRTGPSDPGGKRWPCLRTTRIACGAHRPCLPPCESCRAALCRVVTGCFSHPSCSHLVTARRRVICASCRNGPLAGVGKRWMLLTPRARGLNYTAGTLFGRPRHRARRSIRPTVSRASNCAGSSVGFRSSAGSSTLCRLVG